MTKEEILKDIRAIDDKDNPLLRCDNEGKALLYAVEKTAERTKREMIEKAVKWMYNYFVIDHYGMTSAGFGLFELAFKQAMQDESK
jgi:hypothetical protein